MAYPAEAFIKSKQYQYEQEKANSPTNMWGSLGQGVGQGIIQGVNNQQDQGNRLRQYRAAMMADFLQKNMLFDEQGQQLPVDRIGQEYQGYIVNGKLSPGITTKPLNIMGKTAETESEKLARIEKEARARAQGALAGGMGGTSVDTKVFEQENKLRDDYRKDVGDFPGIRDSFTRIKASAKDPSAAGDLALIFNYMKVLDPGSTVREGEFATAQNSGSAFSIVGALYNKVIAGQRLTDIQRKDFVDRASRLYAGRERQYKKTRQDYQKRIKAYGLNADRIMTDFDMALEELAPEDQEALDWANANPDDPRAIEIKNTLGQSIEE